MIALPVGDVPPIEPPVDERRPLGSWPVGIEERAETVTSRALFVFLWWRLPCLWIEHCPPRTIPALASR
jgi:hypothetical protein